VSEPTSALHVQRPAARLRANLTIVLISWGVFGACWYNSVLGAPYTAYAVALGAGPLMLGFLSASAVLGVVGQVFSSYLIEKTGRLKLIFLTVDLIQRPLWILVGALPFVIPERYGPWRLVGLLGLTFLSSLMGSMGSPAWIGWMAHVIPVRIRARFLGVRFRLATITGMITALTVGAVLDRNSSYPVFFAIFGFAAVMGTIDIAMFIFIPRRYEVRPAEPTPLPAIVTMPWRDRRFRRYLYYAASSAASYTIMGQFLILYLLDGIALGKFYTNLYLLVIPLLVAATLGAVVGRQISYYGNRPVLLVATLAAIPLPLMFGAAGHDSHLLLASTAVLAGIVTAVLGVAELNLLFAMTPEAKRSAYLAGVALVAGTVGAAAPIAGGVIAQSLAHWHLMLGGFRLTNLHVVFLAATALRIIHAAVFVPRLPEARARPARDLIADVFRGPMDVAGVAVRRVKRR